MALAYELTIGAHQSVVARLVVSNIVLNSKLVADPTTEVEATRTDVGWNMFVSIDRTSTAGELMDSIVAMGMRDEEEKRLQNQGVDNTTMTDGLSSTLDANARALLLAASLGLRFPLLESSADRDAWSQFRWLHSNHASGFFVPYDATRARTLRDFFSSDDNSMPTNWSAAGWWESDAEATRKGSSLSARECGLNQALQVANISLPAGDFTGTSEPSSLAHPASSNSSVPASTAPKPPCVPTSRMHESN